MRILLTIIIILVLIGAIAYMWAKRTFDKITFLPPTLSESLKGLTMATISGQTISLPLTFHIKNESNSSIPFGITSASLSYNGNLIAETTDNSSYFLPANSILSVTKLVNFTLNDDAKALLALKIQGGHPVIEYEIHASIFGIPLDKIPFMPPIKDTITW